MTRREMEEFMQHLSGDDATTITGRLDALKPENAALTAPLAGVSRNGDTMLFD